MRFKHKQPILTVTMHRGLDLIAASHDSVARIFPGKSDTLKLYQSYNCEEFSGSWTSLIRYANGRLETIDFSNHIDGEFVLIAIRDETGDGRPDLIFKRSVYGTQCGSGFSEEYDTVNVLAEISGDGAFDFNSNAAIAFMRTQCPAPPEVLNTIEKVACARVWGVSEADALAGIKKVRREGCKSETDSSDDYPALLAAAKLQFPLVLVTAEAKQIPDTQSDTETLP
ncbi:MAG: hypothetical protein JXX14_07455 [Deltaproteobacteria bacterium]|nr:hypothetical protein [Deltaproteobacteria bacterium]